MTIRESGFYWVKPSGGAWTIRRWHAYWEGWREPKEGRPVKDAYYEKIQNNRLLPPEAITTDQTEPEEQE